MVNMEDFATCPIVLIFCQAHKSQLDYLFVEEFIVICEIGSNYNMVWHINLPHWWMFFKSLRSFLLVYALYYFTNLLGYCNLFDSCVNRKRYGRLLCPTNLSSKVKLHLVNIWAWKWVPNDKMGSWEHVATM